MLRVIALALAVFLSLGAIIPLATNSSEASSKQSKNKKKREWKGVRKYSKRWWALYHRQEKRKKALAARKQALSERQEMLASRRAEDGASEVSVKYSADDKARQSSMTNNSATAAVLPSGERAPQSWKNGKSTSSEMQFRVEDSGMQIGSAQLSVIGPAQADDDSYSSRTKSLGGVSTGALRRTVIDRMMKEDGWVVNDYQKEMNGKKVFVVVAQSKGANGQTQSRLFYFTEVEGKIYSLATSAPNEASERLAQESEKVINSLQRGNRPTQAGLR